MAIERIPTAGMSLEDWKKERRNSLGGSDIGAVIGLNPYRSAYSVWAEKTGRMKEPEDNEAMRQGRDLEQYVAERFTERSGKRVERCNYLLRNSSAPYLHANIDRRVIGERSGLECKTASALSLKRFSGGEFPESYYAQCVTYLAVTGWERWYLAALVLNKAFYIYQITTIPGDSTPEWCESSVYVSPDEQSALKRCASEFWETHVLPDRPPDVDGTPSTSEALRSLYPEDNGIEIELFGRDALLEQYRLLQTDKAELERRLETIRQTIQQDMGSAGTAHTAEWRATWKTQERRSFDAKGFSGAHPELDLTPFYRASRTRVFRLTEVKK